MNNLISIIIRIRRRIESYKYSRLHKKSHKKFLSFFDFFHHDDYFDYIKEFILNTYFHDIINNQMVAAGITKSLSSDPFGWYSVLYYLIRKIRPEIIVETGVWYGNSSAIILLALDNNKYGRLFSIDLPAQHETGGYSYEFPCGSGIYRSASLPQGRSPGFTVPDYLKNRWELILGDSRIELPKLFQKLQIVDMFLHDSLHSYENMMFEFTLAHKFLKQGGYILSDNINWNNAFTDFNKGLSLQACTYLAYNEEKTYKHNFGVIRV
jgi:predicted O-methyltransferase YrrM